MRKHFFFAGLLAAMATFSACSSDDVAADQDNGFKGGKAYIAVNIVNQEGPGTRALADGDLADGDDTENAVGTTRIYFFKGNEPYVVEDGKNYVIKTINYNKDENDPNVEKNSDPVIVIDGKNDLPDKMVAVLNPPADLTENTISLSDLEAKAGAYLHDASNHFVITNSVYADNGKIDYTVLNGNSFQKSEDEAKANAVNVYVERTAAKVTTTFSQNGQAVTKYEVGTTTDGKKIYAVIKGWQLVTVPDKTNLLKNIDPTWAAKMFGDNEPWNDAARHRSYWASMPASFGLTGKTWNATSTSTDASVYTFENTSATNNTNVFIAATLQDEDGKPVDLAIINGEHTTKDGALVRVAQSVAGKIWYKAADNTYKELDQSMIEFEESNVGNGEAVADDYNSYARLTTVNEAKEFFKDNEGKEKLTKDEVNAELKKHTALVYLSGNTYYYTPIKHLGDKPGVVRNHWYKVEITGIQGLGTPVFNPEKNIVIPDTPTDEKAYVAAQIHILAWRVINQQVNIDTNKK